MTFSRIIGTGSYLPAKVVTNDDLARTVDTSDEWIRTRTGIHSRHVAAEGELASDLALHASQKALQAARLQCLMTALNSRIARSIKLQHGCTMAHLVIN